MTFYFEYLCNSEALSHNPIPFYSHYTENLTLHEPFNQPATQALKKVLHSYMTQEVQLSHKTIKELADRGANLRVCSDAGYNIAHVIAKGNPDFLKNCLEIERIKEILDDVDVLWMQSLYEKESPLHIAVLYCNFEIIDFFTRPSRRAIPALKNRKGQTALDIFMSWCFTILINIPPGYALAEDIEYIGFCLLNLDSDHKYVDDKNSKPRIKVCKMEANSYGTTKIRELYEAITQWYRPGKWDSGLLHTTLQKNNLGVKSGTPLDSRDLEMLHRLCLAGMERRNVLHVACLAPGAQALQIICSCEKTILDEEKKQTTIAKYIKRHKEQLLSAFDVELNSPLHLAVRRKNEEAVIFLVQELGANPRLYLPGKVPSARRLARQIGLSQRALDLLYPKIKT